MYVIFYCTINYCLIVNVLAKVNNVITIVFKKYLYNVDCKIIVGGAVVTADYAEQIGADYYAKDAKESVDIARKFFGN
jgi:5-methyltetrahydrofolate--homocysteine methyltransferase